MRDKIGGYPIEAKKEGQNASEFLL